MPRSFTIYYKQEEVQPLISPYSAICSILLFPYEYPNPAMTWMVHYTLRNVWVANSSLYDLTCYGYWHILSLLLCLATIIPDGRLSSCQVPAYRRSFTLWIYKKLNITILRRSYRNLLLSAVARWALSTVFLKALEYFFSKFESSVLGNYLTCHN